MYRSNGYTRKIKFIYINFEKSIYNFSANQDF